MLERSWVFAFPVLLAGCFGGEEPLPPAEALARAAQRIGALLAQDRALYDRRATWEPGQRPSDPTAVRLWFYTHPNMAVLLAHPSPLDAFNAEHARVRLTQQYIGDWYVAVQKLTVSLAAGDLPDMALVKRGWLARLIASGRIAELDGILPDRLMQDLRPEARAALSAHGHLYAVPADGFCSVLFYNRERVGEEPPRTWDDLLAIARRLGPPDPDPRKARYAIGDLPFIETLWSAGGYVCRGRDCGLDRPEAREALDFVVGLRAEQLAHPYALGNPQHALDLFLAGKVAMTVASSENLPLAQRAPFPLGVAPVPGKTGPVSRLSDNAVVVFREHAEGKRAAISHALAFLTGPDLQGAEAMVRGSVPVRESVAGKPDMTNGLEHAYREARHTPLVGPWGAVEFELARYVSLAYRFEPVRPEAE